MNYPKIISEICRPIKDMDGRGNVASYIPELSTIDPDKFGAHLTTIEDQHFRFGDSNEKFSIQSIAKVFSLVLAYKLENEKLWQRVGVEPSGTSFNSLVQLEHDQGMPRNPLLNAGALVVCDVLVTLLEDPKKEFLEFVRTLSCNDHINYNPKIAESEKATGYRNSALIYLMKSFGNINNEIDIVLDFYFHLCSIEMTCGELSRTFLFLANQGKDPCRNEVITSASESKRINSIMQLCGFYDEAGEFSFNVGLPGKSGVGGGIVAVLPNQYSIAVWSPRLNEKGNSYKGMKFLEMFTTKTEYSIF